ncbi:MAG: RDD family protein [Streptosporangiaceae bacterium]
MSERRSAGSRPDGPGPASAVQKYPGERLGLPESGAGSVAGLGRRFVALVIDWLLCMLIALAAFGHQEWTIVVFAVEVYLLTALTGFTIGKRLLAIRVVRLDGQPVGLLWSLVRTALLLAVVPAVVFDKDTRGLHDKAANTVVIRV